MGLKTTDVFPLGANGPTATTPPNKDIQVKVYGVTRQDTANPVKCVLPADATIIDIAIVSPNNNDAGTTATVSVGIPGNATYFVNDTNVKVPFYQRPTSGVRNIPNFENTPLGGDILITSNYIETGTVSTTGGPYYVIVEYVR